MKVKQIFQQQALSNVKSLVLLFILGPVASLTVFSYELIDLGQNVEPLDISNNGTVVGAKNTDQYPTVAFVWTAIGGFQELDGLSANAVNDHEEVTGNSLTGAFFYDGNTLTHLRDFTPAASHGERTRGLVVPRRRRSVVLSESER